MVIFAAISTFILVKVTLVEVRNRCRNPVLLELTERLLQGEVLKVCRYERIFACDFCVAGAEHFTINLADMRKGAFSISITKRRRLYFQSFTNEFVYKTRWRYSTFQLQGLKLRLES